MPLSVPTAPFVSVTQSGEIFFLMISLLLLIMFHFFLLMKYILILINWLLFARANEDVLHIVCIIFFLMLICLHFSCFIPSVDSHPGPIQSRLVRSYERSDNSFKVEWNLNLGSLPNGKKAVHYRWVNTVKLNPDASFSFKGSIGG